MVGQSRKWMVLVATTWVQAFTGTNFDFSSYSSDLKSVLGISQVQLNYLSVASDMGKAFGWCSGVSLMYLPLWVVMFMAAFLGLFGYGFQYLVIQRIISLPYFLVSTFFLFFSFLIIFFFIIGIFGFRPDQIFEILWKAFLSYESGKVWTFPVELKFRFNALWDTRVK